MVFVTVRNFGFSEIVSKGLPSKVVFHPKSFEYNLNKSSNRVDYQVLGALLGLSFRRIGASITESQNKQLFNKLNTDNRLCIPTVESCGLLLFYREVVFVALVLAE